MYMAEESLGAAELAQAGSSQSRVGTCGSHSSDTPSTAGVDSVVSVEETTTQTGVSHA